MDVQGIIVYIAVYAIPVVFAITLHEAGHAYAARFFGDKTAWMLGRTSLNPARHIDPIGTVVVPVLTAFTGFLFGWAKPVPVNFENLRDPKRDMLWVAAAGPGDGRRRARVAAAGFALSALLVHPACNLIPFDAYRLAIEPQQILSAYEGGAGGASTGLVP